MEQGFIDILQKLTAEQGKEALLNESKCKALLADYSKNEYKKESRFLFQALEAGVPKAIDTAKELRECKKQQIKLLHEEYSLDDKVAADVVNTLALVLKGTKAELEAYAAFERGNIHYENNDYDKAFTEFTEAIRLDPNLDSAYYKRAYTCIKKRQWNQAISDCTEAIRLDPDFPGAYSRRGLCYNAIGQQEKAISDFTEVIRLDPNNAGAYGGRGDAYCQTGQFDKGINDLSEAIRLDPNDVYNYTGRGMGYASKGQNDKAIEDFEKALSMTTDEGYKEFIKNNLRDLRGY